MADLRSIIRVQRERRHNGQIRRQNAYYISSLKASAAVILGSTRRHWTIETSYHWVLDVTFGEDYFRIRDGKSSKNMANLRATILNLLKRDTRKNSLRQNASEQR